MDQNCEGWGTEIWRTVDKWTECRSLSIFLHITLFFASLGNHLVIGFTSINNINKLPRFLLRDRLKVFYPNPTAAFWMLLIAPVVNFYKIRSRVIKNLSASWLMRSFNTYIFVEKWCAVGVWCVRSLRMRRKYWSFKENCLVGSWLFSYVQVCGFFRPSLPVLSMFAVNPADLQLDVCVQLFTGTRTILPHSTGTCCAS